MGEKALLWETTDLVSLWQGEGRRVQGAGVIKSDVIFYNGCINLLGVKQDITSCMLLPNDTACYMIPCHVPEVPLLGRRK